MRIDMRIGATKMPSTRPIEVAYVITDFGRSALAVLDQLREWAEAQNV
jgi:DNA-binding HxlR family transcriptional regulator